MTAAGTVPDWAAARGALEAIVFDLDGTLYESPDLAAEIARSAARYVAGLRGVTEDEGRELLAATRQRLTAARGGETPLTVACTELGGTAAELHRHFIADIDPGRHLTRDEGVVRMLASLQRHYPLYIYTNNNEVLATQILALLGIGEFFSRVFTIEFSWRPKPDKETLRELFAAIGTEPATTLFVGDRHDIDLALPAQLGAPVQLVATVPRLLELGELLTARR